jgi:hypothetical protein
VSQRLPTYDHVRQAMRRVLLDAADTGRRATITSVERALGIAHPTFYRNYPDLIAWFRTETASTPDGTVHVRRTTGAGAAADDSARLRRENEDLRRTVRLYAEKIRQLTIDNQDLHDRLHRTTGVVNLDSRRTTPNHDPDTGDNPPGTRR